MSNDLIPSNMPSARDIQEMSRLRAIMNGDIVPASEPTHQAHYTGGYTGTRQPINESRAAPAYAPSFGTSREEVDAMKNILHKLNNLSGDPEPVCADPVPALTESTTYASTSASTYNQTPESYEVLIRLKESNGKEIRSYYVVDSNRRDVVADLKLQEAAQAIMKLMNKGLSLTSPRVQEIIDLEEEFNRNRMETSRHKARYTRSMELNESAAAEVFKTRFNVAKANAIAAQDQIKSILGSIR